jgi:HPt (histidine-containing phosphotransfer) domain-containing protein
MLFGSVFASAFQRFRSSVIFAKRYFRLLFSRLASLHLAFHWSRLRQKNRSNLDIGLRNGHACQPTSDHLLQRPKKAKATRPQHKTTIKGTKTGQQHQITFSPHFQRLSPAHLEGLRRLAHAVKGTGGSVGFAPISEAAKRLEKAVQFGDGEETEEALAELHHMAARLVDPSADSLVSSDAGQRES